MESPFVYWKNRSVKHGAIVTDLEGVDKVYAMMDGESFANIFPSTAAFHFDPAYKRDTLLVDSLINIEGMLVCSQRLKDFIESHHPDKVEYLPVAIYDHKDKPVSEPYFIVHPIDPVDCIDFDKSDLVWSALDKTSLLHVQHLELDQTKVPATRLLFRATAHTARVILKREFALQIEKAGFKGAGWAEID